MILLPFYLFRYANQLKEIEDKDDKIKEIEDELDEINQRLWKMYETGEIGAYQKRKIQELLLRVSEKLTIGFEKIRKGVDDVMSGDILRTEADDILDQGIEKGIERGREDATVNHLKNIMKSFNVTIDKAMDSLMIPQDQRTMYAGLVENS